MISISFLGQAVTEIRIVQAKRDPIVALEEARSLRINVEGSWWGCAGLGGVGRVDVGV